MTKEYACNSFKRQLFRKRDVPRGLIVAEAQIHRLAQFAIRSQFLIGDLRNEPRSKICDSAAARRVHECCFAADERLKFFVELGKRLSIEAGSYLADVAKIAVFICPE